jgi:hypothetical protein
MMTYIVPATTSMTGVEVMPMWGQAARMAEEIALGSNAIGA